MTLRHGSLFSGIGGFDLAAEWVGWKNVFHCEWNEFGQKVLKHYWPEAESYGDITKTDFSKWRGSVDIISGGFPCQPYSSAGKRLGKEDERHLWPEMLRVIREVRPRYVVGENVYGLLNWNGGLVFDEVHADLAAEGYETQAVVIPAAAVNAPHGRDRVWFVGHERNCKFGFTTCENRGFMCEQCEEGENYEYWTTTNTNSNGFNERNGNNEKQSSEGGKYAQRDAEQSDGDGDATNTNSKRCKWQREQRSTREKGERSNKRFGKLGNFKHQWQKFPTQSPICGGNDGLPSKLDGITFPKWRAESIKAYGNAIVPQVAYQIFKTIEQTKYENY